ncbi:hypothetical protein ACWGLF_41280 [Streptomyces puniciscabiei]
MVTEAQLRNLFGEGRHPLVDRVEAGQLAAGKKPAAVRGAGGLGRQVKFTVTAVDDDGELRFLPVVSEGTVLGGRAQETQVLNLSDAGASEWVMSRVHRQRRGRPTPDQADHTRTGARA